MEITQSAAWLLKAGIPIVLGTIVATAALILLLFPLLRRYALARPNARSSHKAPTPQGGVSLSTLQPLWRYSALPGGPAGAER